MRAVEGLLVERLSYRTWLVMDADGSEYYVFYDGGRFRCTCPDFIYYGDCRHIEAVIEYNRG